ncbi:MAG: acyl-CoA dehydrogenase family protein [Mycobacteriales bacterium]
MDFRLDTRTAAMVEELQDFLETCVYPAEPVYAAQEAEQAAEGGWDRPRVMTELQAEARHRGLWNLFSELPTLAYAPLAELTGRSPWLAPEAVNCAAPDAGNMAVLAEFGTAAQRERWLRPLLTAETRSAFSMTEPDAASSDATTLGTRIEPDAGGWRITGRKWWSTGAMSPRCAFTLVLGVSDPDADPYHRHSLVIVPLDTPGVTVHRSTPVFGYRDGPHGGHAELSFDGAWVPADHLLGEEGGGFVVAQSRLGPSRVHHCMRLVGMAERALELLCRRAVERVAFGRPLADQGVVREWIARSRLAIDQVRLLIMRAAWLLDTGGPGAARTEVAAIKATAPRVASRVIDRAIQAHGAAGLSEDLPLARLYAAARALHFADGPDEVQLHVVARNELRRYRVDQPT